MSVMITGPLPLASLLSALTPLIHEAGDLVMRIYATDFQVEVKGDDSPVTLADQCAEKVIFEGLRRLAPGIPIVGEEAASAGDIPDVSNRFWLVDPIDGTKEFVNRNGEFTVNIALIDHGVPVLGLVLAPALETLYAGAAGLGAWVEIRGQRRAIAVRGEPADGLTVVGSRHHGNDRAVDAFLAGRRVAAQRMVGSSLKLCILAEGLADVYPRFGRTMEWDTAAGDAVLRAAGGSVRTIGGAALAYGKPGFENPDFAAWGAT
ncbi:3'(2'),5'-bisphosphate nucleotidase CysQ [Scleromatobacter humisilvae]|uniref:3'(2'),5'-bisphosphate nucleotidase CysQ n=1 Tax=Scleromatobacter humisilvae TaxID=2897159 RepID=A0A9X1YI66_9BURK|nr:3'(2'),5'-bisphosphate nucleotidase CysQ [Scleromatobacter humisilvae]MCK9685845.1 3'(2'),5'-bisphosphate nucleotidase CysQ [Scleromatobacter humisilvae]